MLCLDSRNAMDGTFENTTMHQMPIAPPNNFDFLKPEFWPHWKKRFERYIRIANLSGKPESEKIDMLCYIMGEQSEAILVQIMPHTDGKSLKDVLQAFTDHFCPDENVILARFKFNTRIQLEDESVDQFVTALHTLAKSCQYGNMKNELIRDRMIVGLSGKKNAKKPLLEPHMTLENAVIIAREIAVQRSQLKLLEALSLPSEINCAGEGNVQEIEINNQAEGTSQISKKKKKKKRKKGTQNNATGQNSDSNLKAEGNSEYGSSGDMRDSKIVGESMVLNSIRKMGGPEPRKARSKSSHSEHRIGTQNVSENAISNKLTGIHSLLVRMKNNVELKETDDFQISGESQERVRTKALYKKVQAMLNKLTPETFDKSVNQIRTLEIDSLEKLQGVVELIFQRAVDEPSFSVIYALICKELALMQVSGPDTKAGKEESTVNFRKLIINRCQMEFEKNTVDENAGALKMIEIEACADPKKKKELQLALNEEERRIRIKSVGNIRFIGELFKQQMLTTNIMHRCIRHLLTQIDEESLECLCKLLSTIGKDLESKNQNLEPYFKQMLDIVNRKVPGKVSSRVRFMLQDVIELRSNKWVPRLIDSNQRTLDQIQKEAETEDLDTCLNNTSLNTPTKEDSNGKRNLGHKTTEEDGWWSGLLEDEHSSVDALEIKDKTLSMIQIHERLLSLMSNENENSFGNICSWISANVGERASEPQFMKVLMTVILEVSIEPYNNTWKFRPDKFQNLQTLISRFIEVNVELELPCLIAVQEYMHKLDHPPGVLLQIIEKLWDENIISYDAFLAWKSNKDPTALTGKSVAMFVLTMFFCSLKAADDESSGGEL